MRQTAWLEKELHQVHAWRETACMSLALSACYLHAKCRKERGVASVAERRTISYMACDTHPFKAKLV